MIKFPFNFKTFLKLWWAWVIVMFIAGTTVMGLVGWTLYHFISKYW